MGKDSRKRCVTAKQTKRKSNCVKRQLKAKQGHRKVKTPEESVLSVGFWNVRSLTDERKETISTLVENEKYDLLCLAETWGRADAKSIPFNLKGYSSLRNERLGAARKGGGLLLFVRDNLKVIPYMPASPKELDDVATKRIWALGQRKEGA